MNINLSLNYDKLNNCIDVFYKRLNEKKIDINLNIIDYISFRDDLDLKKNNTIKEYSLVKINNNKIKSVKFKNINIQSKKLLFDLITDLGILVTTQGITIIFVALKFILELTDCMTIKLTQNEADLILRIILCKQSNKKSNIENISNICSGIKYRKTKMIDSLNRLCELSIIKKVGKEWIMKEKILIKMDN